jgi:hypothetical protein
MWEGDAENGEKKNTNEIHKKPGGDVPSSFCASS